MRFCSTESGSFFFQPFEFHFESSNLLIKRCLKHFSSFLPSTIRFGEKAWAACQ